MTVTIIDVATSVEAQNIAPQPIVTLHPNPATDRISVVYQDKMITGGNTRIVVFDLAGQKILDLPLKENLNFDVSSWHSGMYFYHILNSNTSVSSGKLVVN
jgi:hypothetical protein